MPTPARRSTDHHAARWWRVDRDGRVLCTLCPRYCRLPDGKAGFCFIRKNEGGKLVALGYGRPTSLAVDPIEKKPLNHFLPGSSILSFGTAGCNLGCKFCQNWDTSKARLNDLGSYSLMPDEIVRTAVRERCHSIAYTYNDPIIFGEYVIDTAKAAREAGLKNVMVTAGYVTPEARGEIFEFIDGANVDLKAFSETFYHKLTLAHLQPVLDTLVWLRRDTDVWIEITTLLIPGLNDDDDEIRDACAWVLENLGDDVPLHYTAFHPDFRMTDRPRTPTSTLRRAREIAIRAGLKYVYVGNVVDPDGQTTWCPGCGEGLVRRGWHSVSESRIDDGTCPSCGTAIAGVFGNGTDGRGSDGRPRSVRP